MDVYAAAQKRRSIRKFRDLAVPYAFLEKCVDAGRLAPNAKNLQVLEYIIVDDERLLPEMHKNTMMIAAYHTGKVKLPPEQMPHAYIVTLINTALESELGGARQYAAYDIGMSAQNMMLVAVEQGLATCPILMFREAGLRQALALPDSCEIGMVLALGYPGEDAVVEAVSASIEYTMDGQGVRHVPKRILADILHRNVYG